MMRAAFYISIHIVDDNETKDDTTSAPTLMTNHAPDFAGDTNSKSEQITIRYLDGEQFLFTDQRLFGRYSQSTSRKTYHPRSLHQNPNTSRHFSKPRSHYRPLQLCFNCEKPNCTVKRCPIIKRPATHT